MKDEIKKQILLLLKFDDELKLAIIRIVREELDKQKRKSGK
jgi:hypothetical protein